MDRYQSSVMEESERLRLFWAVGRGLERIADGRRLLLLLDDLQWADDSTIQMLHFLLRQIDATVPEAEVPDSGSLPPRGSSSRLYLWHFSTGNETTIRGHRQSHLQLEPLPQSVSQQVISAQLGGLVAPDSVAKIANLVTAIRFSHNR